ncbi:thioredoxin family protein [Aestuariibaculum suncheonense]|uniref:Thioredoxin family protein n=1 Tax=Aestuariibaculum suncheonense TaxID=1028745 RepID=A0A8J6UA84_9FLAO|nr:thioredoxin family protein [Aestuariibaculum suncheonense]MBD0834077.1 thioredoxin family protein [Aestuariibaculum suncheonense]
MKSIIKTSLDRSMSYEAYRDLVKRLAEEHSTTGLEQTEGHKDFTKLNDRRMKRWDKTIKIPEISQKRISKLSQDITWLVIAESWCGDAAHVLPVLKKIADVNSHITYRVVLRDENPELMDAFLTKGARSIPMVIIIDDSTGEVLSTYGPRPTEATTYVQRFIAKNGKLTPEFKEDLQHWYNSDKGQNIVNDITEILCGLESKVCL